MAWSPRCARSSPGAAAAHVPSRSRSPGRRRHRAHHARRGRRSPRGSTRAASGAAGAGDSASRTVSAGVGPVGRRRVDGHHEAVRAAFPRRRSRSRRRSSSAAARSGSASVRMGPAYGAYASTARQAAASPLRARRPWRGRRQRRPRGRRRARRGPATSATLAVAGGQGAHAAGSPPAGARTRRGRRRARPRRAPRRRTSRGRSARLAPTRRTRGVGEHHAAPGVEHRRPARVRAVRAASADALARSRRRARYWASWSPTVANIAAISPLGSRRRASRTRSRRGTRRRPRAGTRAAVISPARSARGARVAGRARRRSTQDGRRKAHTRPGQALAGGEGLLARRARRTPPRLAGASAACQTAAQRRMRAVAGRQTAPSSSRARSPSVASTRSHSASGSRPAARWSAIACWATSSWWAPPTRWRMRACSSSRVARRELRGFETTARGSAGRGPPRRGRRGRTCGETATNGRCGSARRTSASALRAGTAPRPVAAVEHGVPAAPLQRRGQRLSAAARHGPRLSSPPRRARAGAAPRARPARRRAAR